MIRVTHTHSRNANIIHNKKGAERAGITFFLKNIRCTFAWKSNKPNHNTHTQNKIIISKNNSAAPLYTCKSQTYLKTHRSNLLYDIARIITQWFWTTFIYPLLFWFWRAFLPISIHLTGIFVAFVYILSKWTCQAIIIYNCFYFSFWDVSMHLFHILFKWMVVIYLWLCFPENLLTKKA